MLYVLLARQGGGLQATRLLPQEDSQQSILHTETRQVPCNMPSLVRESKRCAACGDTVLQVEVCSVVCGHTEASSDPTEEFTAQCHPAATAYPDHGMILPDLFLSGIPKDNSGHQKALFSLCFCFMVSSRLLPFPQFSLESFFHQFGVTIAPHALAWLPTCKAWGF